MGVEAGLQISRASYELCLISAPRAHGEKFVKLKDDLFRAHGAALDDMREWVSDDVFPFWGIHAARTCPWAELWDPAGDALNKPRGTDFCEPLRNPDRWPNLMRPGATEKTCGNCKLSENRLWMLDAEHSPAQVAVTLGVYDFAVLTCVPSIIAGNFVRKRLRDCGAHDEESSLDFVSVSASRIEERGTEDSMPTEPAASFKARVAAGPSDGVCAYAFIQPAGWTACRGGLEDFVQSFFNRRRDWSKDRVLSGVRAEAFLCYSSEYPVFVRILAPDDESARMALWALYGDKTVEDSWTVYGRISDQGRGLCRECKTQSHGVDYLLAVNIPHHVANEGITDEIRTALAGLNGIKVEPESGSRFMFGHYDYLFRISGLSSDRMITQAIAKLRGLRREGRALISRMVTIPTLEIPAAPTIEVQR